jgi:ankyrin repeat protein
MMRPWGEACTYKVLLERAADTHAGDTDGLTALDYAKKMDRADAVRLLEASSNKPDIPTEDGERRREQWSLLRWPCLRNLWVVDTSGWRRGPQVAYRLQA